MDRIQKFLQQLTKKERGVITKILSDICVLKTKNYDIKPLEGVKGLFRLRKGKIRIIFTKIDEKGIIINIARRKDAYK